MSDDYKNFLKWIIKKKKDDNKGGASGPTIHLHNTHKFRENRFHQHNLESVYKLHRRHNQQHFPQFVPRQHDGPEIH